MTETMHEALIDRMPEVARGAGDWSPDETAHLAACADCRAAWQVVRAGASVGRGVEREFAASAAGDRVIARLRSAGPEARQIRRWALGVIAAAAAVLFVVTRTPPAAPASSLPAAEARFLPELDSLSTAELATVAEGIDAPVGSADLIEGQPLYDLDSTQLERVLRSLEG